MAALHRLRGIKQFASSRIARCALQRPWACCSSSDAARDRYIQYSKVPTMHYQPSLPRLPIPKLSDTCQRYLQALKPLVDNRAYEETRKMVEEFGREGGQGEVLNKKLIQSDKENKHTSYISGPWFDMYLKYREALVLNHNPFVMFNDIPQLTNQLDRAANVIWSSVRFRQALKDGVLAPEVFHLQPEKSDVNWFKNIIRFVPSSLSWYGAYLMKAFPLDMSHYDSLFNSTRLPHAARDQLITYDDNATTNHVLVLRQGHAYKIKCITDEGDPVPVAHVRQCLQEIVSDTRPPPEHPLGFLTTMKRGVWAGLRDDVLASNAASLEAIDSSLFVLCLEDEEPTTPEQVSRMMLYGDATNRWFDKSFSYIVTPTGRTALNFEHSWGDGVAVIRMMNEVYKDNLSNPQLPAAEPAPPTPVERVEFALPDNVKEAISQARKDYQRVTSSLAINTYLYEGFGKNLVKKNNLSPDAIMQLMFQIAYYRLFKCSPATYESCSTAAFRHGRTETIRPVSVASRACVEAFEETSSAGTYKLLQLLAASSTHHGKLTKEAAMGQGFDRHFFALNLIAKAEELTVPMFEDPSYTKMSHIILSTSTLASDAVMFGGFAPVNPDCYGIGYNISDDQLGFHVTSYPSCDGARFVSELETVAQQLQALLDAKNFE